MITFMKDRIVLEIKDNSPVEYWIDLHEAILRIIRYLNTDMIDDDTFYIVADFLDEWMPDHDTAVRCLNP